MFYKNCVLYFFCLMLIACNNKNPYANSLGIDPALAAQIDTAHYTLIKWKDSVINFGTIKEGDSVILKYEFYNAGNTPLFVVKTLPACGCTITSFSKDFVMPGKSGFINGVFRSLYHSGITYKTIRVTTNTRNKSNHLLIFKGTVEPLKNQDKS